MLSTSYIIGKYLIFLASPACMLLLFDNEIFLTWHGIYKNGALVKSAKLIGPEARSMLLIILAGRVCPRRLLHRYRIVMYVESRWRADWQKPISGVYIKKSEIFKHRRERMSSFKYSENRPYYVR